MYSCYFRLSSLSCAWVRCHRAVDDLLPFVSLFINTKYLMNCYKFNTIWKIHNLTNYSNHKNSERERGAKRDIRYHYIVDKIYHQYLMSGAVNVQLASMANEYVYYAEQQKKFARLLNYLTFLNWNHFLARIFLTNSKNIRNPSRNFVQKVHGRTLTERLQKL